MTNPQKAYEACTNHDVVPASPTAHGGYNHSSIFLPCARGPAGDNCPELDTNLPEDIWAGGDPCVTSTMSCTASHVVREIHGFALLQGAFCCAMLSCLFVFKYPGSRKRVTVLFFSPHMLYSFPSHTHFLLTQ